MAINAQGDSTCCPICSKLRKELIFELTKTNKEKLFQMTTIAELSHKLQHLLSEQANELAKKQGLSNDNGK